MQHTRGHRGHEPSNPVFVPTRKLTPARFLCRISSQGEGVHVQRPSRRHLWFGVRSYRHRNHAADARFGIGFVIGAARLPWPAWAVGLCFGLLLSIPDAIITKAYGPIIGMGAIGGTVIGIIIGRFGR
jgi:hypothetical protein